MPAHSLGRDNGSDKAVDGHSSHYPHAWRGVLLTAFHLLPVPGSEVETRSVEDVTSCASSRLSHFGQSRGNRGHMWSRTLGNSQKQSIYDLPIGSKRLLPFKSQCENEVLSQQSQDGNKQATVSHPALHLSRHNQ